MKAIYMRTFKVVRAISLCTAVILLTGYPMTSEAKETLPRFTKLDAFNPHRASFECRHEASVNPTITSQAEALFQEAQALTSYELWPEKRNYAKAAELYEKAMTLGHWKAQFNLAGQYLRGLGVRQDAEKALTLTEDLMKQGVPAAWDSMGAYYMGGLGPLKQDATVAYAFWQKAADMGSMAAQTYLGAKLKGTHDEPPSFWGNRPIALKMLECAFAQGYGQAALELGVTVGNTDKDYPRALRILHEGTKWGSEASANYLSSSFDQGDAFANKLIDPARAERYAVLADALHSNPDLRFPNLDKVLPLPPARLPTWDGKKESLINAAKAVVSAPMPPKKSNHPSSNPAPKLTGRAHIPDGWMLPERPATDLPPQYETTKAPETGYWIARLMRPITEEHQTWNALQDPMYYAQGELFDRSRAGLRDEDGRILFHFVGQLVPIPEPDVAPLAFEHPMVARGIARYGDLPQTPRVCRGNMNCPQTGVWSGAVAGDHPLADVFNHWHRQAYVERGQPFPDPKALHLDIEPRAVAWQWLDQANEVRAGDLVYVTVAQPAVLIAGNTPPPTPETPDQG